VKPSDLLAVMLAVVALLAVVIVSCQEQERTLREAAPIVACGPTWPDCP
jgi:hypothetical protein